MSHSYFFGVDLGFHIVYLASMGFKDVLDLFQFKFGHYQIGDTMGGTEMLHTSQIIFQLLHFHKLLEVFQVVFGNLCGSRKSNPLSATIRVV